MLNIKNIKNKIISKVKTNKQTIIQTILVVTFIIASKPGFAGGANTAQLDTVINNIIVPWVRRLGGVIGFIGAIMFALGWRNDDADSKARGINTFVSGFMAAGVAQAYSMFTSI